MRTGLKVGAILALDTATRHASVAVSLGGGFAPGQLFESEREVDICKRGDAKRAPSVHYHSEGLLSLVDETLQAAGLRLSDLDALVCGRGPGSFTGLRIGLATAKGLCLATGKRLLCLSSLLPLGLAAAEVARAGELCAAILDARRHEVYYGLFRNGELIGPEGLSHPEALAGELRRRGEPVLLAGDGACLYSEQLLSGGGGLCGLAPASCHAIHARYLAMAARPRLEAGESSDLASVAPLYIRASDARLPAN